MGVAIAQAASDREELTSQLAQLELKGATAEINSGDNQQEPASIPEVLCVA